MLFQKRLPTQRLHVIWMEFQCLFYVLDGSQRFALSNCEYGEITPGIGGE